MSTIIINLKAGKAIRQTFGHARFLTLVSAGAAGIVDVDIEVAGFARESVRLKSSDQLEVGATGFQAASFTAAVDCQIEVLASVIRLTLNNSDGQAVNASIVGPLPLPVQQVGVTPTDHSGTLAAAAVAQQLMPANAVRRGIWIENLSGTDALWISELGAATQAQPSLKLPPGALYEAPAGGCPIAAISIIGPTLGQPFSAREW